MNTTERENKAQACKAEESRQNLKNFLTNCFEQIRRGIESNIPPSNRELWILVKNLHEMIDKACFEAWQDGFNDGFHQAERESTLELIRNDLA